MSVIALALVVLLLALSPAGAGELQKRYFTATVPGSWVTVEVTYDNGGRNVYTYSRLEDSRSRAVVEFDMEVMEGPGAGTSTSQLYVIGEQFDIADNALGYMRGLETMVTQVGDQVSVTPPTVTEAIRDTVADFSDAFTYEGTEEVAGFDCDRYAYRVQTGGPHPTFTEGSMWLSRQVPFGVVRQTGTVKNADGTPLSSYEQHYLDSGTRAMGTERLIALVDEAAPRAGGSQPLESETASKPLAYTLSEAYDSGAVRLLVAVDSSSGGKRLGISIVNATNEPIQLSISTDENTLRADSPISTLAVSAFESHELELEPGQASPSIRFRQLGDRGVVEGDFSLFVYDGTPLYSGSVSIGSLPK